MHYEKVSRALAASRETFQAELRAAVKSLGLTLCEFAEQASLSRSTLYKALNEARDPKLSTVRAMLAALRRIENAPGTPFIAVIATRPFLNQVTRTSVTVKGSPVPIRDYPANTIEEAIVAAVEAERDGASAVVCAPLIATTVERIVSIPIFALIPSDSLRRTVELAVQRLELGASPREPR